MRLELGIAGVSGKQEVETMRMRYPASCHTFFAALKLLFPWLQLITPELVNHDPSSITEYCANAYLGLSHPPMRLAEVSLGYRYLTRNLAWQMSLECWRDS